MKVWCARCSLESKTKTDYWYETDPRMPHVSTQYWDTLDCHLIFYSVSRRFRNCWGSVNGFDGSAVWERGGQSTWSSPILITWQLPWFQSRPLVAPTWMVVASTDTWSTGWLTNRFVKRKRQNTVNDPVSTNPIASIPNLQGNESNL